MLSQQECSDRWKWKFQAGQTSRQKNKWDLLLFCECVTTITSCSKYMYTKLCLLHEDFPQLVHGRQNCVEAERIVKANSEDLKGVKQSSTRFLKTQFRKKKDRNNKYSSSRLQEDVQVFLYISPQRAKRSCSSFHYSFCFTSGHFQASTGPAASLVPVRHHLGPSSKACLVLRRPDEICMHAEGNWGGGRKTQVPFILVGFSCSFRRNWSSFFSSMNFRIRLFPSYIYKYINLKLLNKSIPFMDWLIF